MKYLAFDIEILKEIPEGEDWHNHRPLGISCAATIRSGDTAPIPWYSTGGFRNGGKMKPVDLLKLIDYMDEQRAQGFVPLTWNGLGFDFDVLAEESGDLETCVNLALGHVDMMFHFLCIKGFPLGLNTAAHGLGLHGKTEGMHGDLAPILWQANHDRLADLGLPDIARDLTPLEMRAVVLEYVGQDVITTLQVAEEVDKKGHLPWTSNSGKSQTAHFPNGWLRVKAAIDLPKPNTSWMTNPLQREDMFKWTGTT